MNLTPERINQMIATAEQRAGRTRRLRRAGAATVGLLAMAATAVGGFALTQPGPERPLAASPAPAPATGTPSPTATQSPTVEPTDLPTPVGEEWIGAAPMPTEWPSAPTADYVSFEEAYSEAERHVILEQVAVALEARDTSQFWAVVTRTTHQDGLNALSPDGDVWIAGADEKPAFALRIGGPLSAFELHGNRRPLSSQEEGEWAATVSSHGLFGLDGTGFMSGIQLAPWDGELPVVPPINPAVEDDPALVPLEGLAEHLPPEPSLSPEDEERNQQLQRTLEEVLPARLKLTMSRPDPADPWQSIAFTVDDGTRSAAGSFNLWHLTPGASHCDDPIRGVCHDSFGWTYRRADDAAIFLSGLNEVLTQEEAVALLTDTAWEPHLDLIQQQPPS